MKARLICCEVLIREACLCIAGTQNVIDPEFTPKGAHDRSDYLRKLIQDRIDETEKMGGYDYILLGYGLCGNGALGIKARSIPIVIPRAHDCCTLFLGSKEKFLEYFKDNLSKEWSSAGYMERGSSYLRESDTGKMLGLDKSYQEFVEQYGEENAKYIWETLHPETNDKELIFIEVPEVAHLRYCDKLKSLAEEEGKTVRVLDGDMRLINMLIDGKWNEDEFLVVPPGKEIKAAYDNDKIVFAG